jgi:DNA polymerase I
MRLGNRDFSEVWACDFEFRAPSGERPQPHCLVARELCSGRTIRLFGPALTTLPRPPFDIGPNSLFVAFYASAEMGCFLSLGWPMPANVLDLFTEFRVLTNGLNVANNLLGALMFFGLASTSAAEKQEMRELAMNNTTFSQQQQQDLLDYCEGDVVGLELLLPKLAVELDLERALLRGRYMKAAARIENVGVPIDVGALTAIKDNWSLIKGKLIERIDASFGVYEGLTFKAARFAAWLETAGIPWPRLESGALELSDDAFKDMARVYPQVSPIRELRYALGQLRLNNLAVGADGRNRCLLSAFQARTGRNQPSNSKFIFGPSVWLRGLIRPAPGMALAYIDWGQQEFGVAAALSGDEAMMSAYQTGDPYLEFAKQAGAVPPAATKQSHHAIREQFKQCALAVQYCMGEKSLSYRLGKTPAEARELLRLHHATYPGFWRWTESAVGYAMLHGKLWTTFGWEIRVGTDANTRSLGNFPMQANGAEMLRLACCFATERGVRVCAPVHDALLIEAPFADLNSSIAATQAAMAEASEIVLNGFSLRSEVMPVPYPDRYMDDKRGRLMWDTVHALIATDGVAK